MKNYALYEKVQPPESSFPLVVHYPNNTLSFGSHWHEMIEMLYCTDGRGVIECDNTPYEIGPGDLLVVNSNELHSGYCLKKPFKYYCLLVSPALLKGNLDGSCEQKYITPIAQNFILFNNKIPVNPMIAECITSITREYKIRELGYELAIKSALYKLFVILLRSHMQKVMTNKEYNARLKKLQRLNDVLEYIQKNYTSKITVDQLAGIACLSRDHFSHLFKKMTGKGVNEYINCFRLEKAELLLKNTDMNITEVAIATGFEDSNYFSRIYKKNKKASPSESRNLV